MMSHFEAAIQWHKQGATVSPKATSVRHTQAIIDQYNTVVKLLPQSTRTKLNLNEIE